MASAQCQKPSTEICQPKSHHSSLGQKFSDLTSKAFKGYHNRNGNNQVEIQCHSQIQDESHHHQGDTHTSSLTETHCYSQTQTKQHMNRGVAKTKITHIVVQTQITQTRPHDATATTCLGNHSKKGKHNTKKERNLFRRIKEGISGHSSDSDTSNSDSDNENCPNKKNRGKEELHKEGK
ncbi:hypothetical protein L6164_019364 [Bauhinia variegata]|uniref:Uncharacterized protein n=1 Tax=Bauhinia variegata TaxID=167791 RepID=A0ACB9MRR5_BAUVA|nr:hypothetical protein L6164_019364 [Bauhinia variegata]